MYICQRGGAAEALNREPQTLSPNPAKRNPKPQAVSVGREDTVVAPKPYILRPHHPYLSVRQICSL